MVDYRLMFSRIPGLRRSNSVTARRATMVIVAAAMLHAGCSAQEVPLPISSATGADIYLRLEARVIEDIVPQRATLAGLLHEHVVDNALVHAVIESVQSVFDPRRLRGGNAYKVFLAADGMLRRFEYHIDNDEFLRVDRATSADDTVLAFDAERVPYIKVREEHALHGDINERNSSLVAALNEQGENVNLAILMASVFGGEIDFHNDLRRGDHFDVLIEKLYRDEEFSEYGDIAAAEFHNDGRTVQAFSFQIPPVAGSDSPGEDNGDASSKSTAAAQYYDFEGRSLKRPFLSSPFGFEPRVTSRFSYRRLHPVLGTHRPHLGVDYGALTGTKVIAVANGDVVSAGMSGGSGNMVRLRHKNGYETYYLHLSRFGKGVRRGARVAQGQVIGYVGATGLATGPHLDYRIRKNGTFVNPLVEIRTMPPGEPIPDGHLAAFFERRDETLQRLSSTHAPVSVAAQ